MELDNNSKDKKSEVQRQKMADELDENKHVNFLPFNRRSTQFIIPRVSKCSLIRVCIDDTECEWKNLIFSALHSVCHLAFIEESLFESTKKECRATIPIFLKYLNSIVISDYNRVSLLKDYEIHRVKHDRVKPQSTYLACIIKLLKKGMNYSELYKTLSPVEFSFLERLTKTKVAPSDDKDQYTLTKWFGFHSWLRRDDIGIGNDMFSRLASPKALTTSFRVTTEKALCEIQEAKYALIDFFLDNDIASDDMLPPLTRTPSYKLTATELKKSKNSWFSYIYSFISNRFSFLQKKYYMNSKPNESLKLGFEMIIYSWSIHYAAKNTTELFLVNNDISRNYMNNQRFNIAFDSFMFSHDFLYELTQYSHSDRSEAIPVCKAEHLLFHWLMAYQSVQSSDISKLRLSNFNFIKRRNGVITHIESSYFKGRSNETHYLKSIKANSLMGKGVLNFINDRTNNNSYRDGSLSYQLKDTSLTTSENGNVGQLIRLIASSSLKVLINEELEKSKATPIFIEALHSIISRGVKLSKYKHKESSNQSQKITREDWLIHCDTPSNTLLFGFSAIKNSSIHARSDSFTPTQLQNHNSHTNDTERNSYLTKDNTEWRNNCGLVTRAVMQDIHINVLSPSKREIQLFNSDFTKAAELIDMRKTDVLSRLKLVTGKDNGRVDELGFFTESKQFREGFIDTLYLEDSPETVLRFYHYIHEVETKHKLLEKQAYEYLLFTVLPTVEWMSILLTESHFTNESITKGKALFDIYKSILPPYFSAQLGS
jgi:hypothetical protein